jgi:uncharacterized protein
LTINPSDGEADAWIEALGLVPHPEGGYYAETHRSDVRVDAPQGGRAASTAIYFLLRPGTFSALHRVRSDEVWHHYRGAPVELHLLDEPAGHRVVPLGPDLGVGQRPQHVVPAGSWQGVLAAREGATLCGCTVAPGFEFADFEMPGRRELTRRMPTLRSWIERLTREP